MSRNCVNSVTFSIVSQAAWAPELDTGASWSHWAQQPFVIADNGESHEPRVAEMPAMLRRRASFVGKMALEVAYRCLAGRTDIPAVFSSRHGECQRSVSLLDDLVRNTPLSPTSFSLSVHNAAAGLLSIARREQANHSALSSGQSGVDHALIEACSLLADGAPEVLVVIYDGVLPEIFKQYRDSDDQAFAWAWLIRSVDELETTELSEQDVENSRNIVSLSWEPHNIPDFAKIAIHSVRRQPAGLEVLEFHLRKDRELQRIVEHQCWHWRHHD